MWGCAVSAPAVPSSTTTKRVRAVTFPAPVEGVYEPGGEVMERRGIEPPARAVCRTLVPLACPPLLIVKRFAIMMRAPAIVRGGGALHRRAPRRVFFGEVRLGG